ncbi:MAG: DotA/TraY family protein [Desulfobacteraceae bacterium]|nr:DotA/TraY family protein [Desulfobacteraceae bacterium]
MPSGDSSGQSGQISDLIGNGPGPGGGDKASEMISEIFGAQWWEVLWSGKEVQGDPSLVMPILQIFNVAVIMAVTLILLYVVAHAFIGSAHEGTPLGRRLHSIWVPVRSVLSISLVTPLPWESCLNFIQGIILVFIGFSIQLANMATTAGVNYLVENQGQVVASPPTDLKDAGISVAQVAMQNYLIQYHQYYFQENDDLVRGYDKHIKPPRDGILGIGARDYTMFNYIFRNPEPYSEDVMGGITIKCADADSNLCQARQSAVETLLKESETIAHEKVQQLYGMDHDLPPPQVVVGYIDHYGTTLLDAIKERISQDNPELQQELEEFGEAIKTQGFAMLGSYYLAMSRFSTALQDQVSSKVSVTQYDSKLLVSQSVLRFNQIDVSLNSMDSYCRKLEYSKNVAEMGHGSITKAESEDGLWTAVGAYLSKPFVSAVDKFIGNISNSEPIACLSATGRHLINGSQAALAGMVGMYAVGAAGSTALGKLPLVGALGDAAKSVINGTAGTLTAAVALALLAPVFLLGLTLAYYLPAVPFLVWTVALIGWIIMVLEAMVAGPVWAAMHASPDGEGIAGDRGSQGYLLFLQILLRPVLMVIGFFFALLMIHVIGHVGGMFTVFFHGLAAEEAVVGPITAAAGIFIGSILMVVLVHKSFHLIFVLPEHLNDWFGNQHASQMGESSDMHESKRTLVGGIAAHSSRSMGNAGYQAEGSLKAGQAGREGSLKAGQAGQAGREGSEALSGGQAEDLQPGESGQGQDD